MNLQKAWEVSICYCCLRCGLKFHLWEASPCKQLRESLSARADSSLPQQYRQLLAHLCPPFQKCCIQKRQLPLSHEEVSFSPHKIILRSTTRGEREELHKAISLRKQLQKRIQGGGGRDCGGGQRIKGYSYLSKVPRGAFAANVYWRFFIKVAKKFVLANGFLILSENGRRKIMLFILYWFEITSDI